DPELRQHLYISTKVNGSQRLVANPETIEFLTKKMPFAKSLLKNYLNDNAGSFQHPNLPITLSDSFQRQFAELGINRFDAHKDAYAMFHNNEKAASFVGSLCQTIAQNQFQEVKIDGVMQTVSTGIAVAFKSLSSISAAKATINNVKNIYDAYKKDYLGGLFLLMIDNPVSFEILSEMGEPAKTLISLNKEPLKRAAVTGITKYYETEIAEINNLNPIFKEELTKNISKVIDEAFSDNLQKKTNPLPLLKAINHLLTSLEKNETKSIGDSFSEFISFAYNNPELKEIVAKNPELIEQMIQIECVKRNLGSSNVSKYINENGKSSLNPEYFKRNSGVAKLIADAGLGIISNINDKKELIDVVEKAMSGNSEKFQESLVNLFETFSKAGGQKVIADNKDFIKDLITKVIEDQQKTEGFAKTAIDAQKISERIYNIMYSMFSNVKDGKLPGTRQKLIKNVAKLFKVSANPRIAESNTANIETSLFDDKVFWQKVDSLRPQETKAEQPVEKVLEARTFEKKEVKLDVVVTNADKPKPIANVETLGLKLKIKQKTLDNHLAVIAASGIELAASDKNITKQIVEAAAEIFKKQFSNEISLFKVSDENVEQNISKIIKNAVTSKVASEENIKQILEQVNKVPGILRSNKTKEFASSVSNLVTLINSNDNNAVLLQSSDFIGQVVGFQLSNMNLFSIPKDDPQHTAIYSTFGKVIADCATRFVLTPTVAKQIDSSLQNILSGDNERLADGIFNLFETLRHNGAADIANNAEYNNLFKFLVTKQIKSMQTNDPNKIITYVDAEVTAERMISIAQKFLSNDNASAEVYKVNAIKLLSKMFKVKTTPEINEDILSGSNLPNMFNTNAENLTNEQAAPSNSLFSIPIFGDLEIHVPADSRKELAEVGEQVARMVINSKSLTDEVKSFSNSLKKMIAKRHEFVNNQGYYYKSAAEMDLPIKMLTIISPQQAEKHLVPFLEDIVTKLHTTATGELKQDVEDLISLFTKDNIAHELNQATISKLTKVAIALIENTNNSPEQNRILENISFITTRMVLTDPRISYKVKGYNLSEENPQTAFIKPLILPILKSINSISEKYKFNVNEPDWYLKLTENFLKELSQNHETDKDTKTKKLNPTQELIRLCVNNKNARSIVSGFMSDINYLNQRGINSYDVFKILDNPSNAGKILGVYQSIYDKYSKSIEVSDIDKAKALSAVLHISRTQHFSRIVAKMIMNFIAKIIDFFAKIFTPKIAFSIMMNKKLEDLNKDIPEGAKTKLEGADVFKKYARKLMKTSPHRISTIQRLKNCDFSDLSISQPMQNMKLDGINFDRATIATNVFNNVLIGEKSTFKGTKYRLQSDEYKDLKNKLQAEYPTLSAKDIKVLASHTSKTEIAKQFEEKILNGSMRFTSVKAANNFVESLKIQNIILSPDVLKVLNTSKLNKKGIEVVGITGAEIRSRGSFVSRTINNSGNDKGNSGIGGL
ncbi:MAG: hypothetical protein J0G32_08165, partial [Alphaproteobacteria bacterium]|nr:hypothetical protein [Alphaproteobacteria bacterium]